MEPNIVKVCKKCGKALPYSEFYSHKNGRYWYAWCKSCWDKKTIEYNKTNKVRCRESDKRRRKERQSKGLCAKCDSPQLSNVVVCEKHYLMRIGRDRLGRSTVEVAKILKDKLAAQNFQCPYTHEKLVLGTNTELDHILPVSRYPDRAEDLDNVEWVSSSINKAKHNCTKDEFIELCRKVVTVAKENVNLEHS